VTANARGAPKQAEKSRRTAEREPFTRQKLEQLALAYVNRFDVSQSKLRKHLAERARKAGADPSSARGWIEELLARYLASGVLNDARLAQNLAAQLGSRGKSTRAIAQKLSARGVASELTEQLLARRREQEPGAELEAARAYVRKRRLGPFRPADERDARRHKDLASLARQGFSFDVARQALGPGPSNDDEF
jgi:regulatory protein